MLNNNKIYVEFDGRLGNQMFQYAAARIQSERLGVELIPLLKGAGRRDYLETVFGIKSRSIFNTFPKLRYRFSEKKFAMLGTLSPAYAQKKINNSIYKHTYRDCDNCEIYTNNVWKIEPGTLMRGFFQSTKYWGDHYEDVVSWFQPNQSLNIKLKILLKNIPEELQNMIAVHVRMSDYAKMTTSYSRGEFGWVLPKDYYVDALAQFPNEFPIALFSDSPLEAEKLLPRKPIWISTGSSPGEDMFLMSMFPNLVVANSTFSWWSAVLNKTKNKRIVAPEFFIGRHAGVWYPPDIFVEGWEYI